MALLTPVAAPSAEPTARFVDSLAEFVLLFTLICLPLIYLYDTAFPLYRLALVAFAFAALARLAAGSSDFKLDRQTIKLVVVAGLLILYMFLVDIYQNDPRQGLEDALKRLVVVLALPASELMGLGHTARFRRIILIGLVPMFFGTAQIFDPTFTFDRLWPNIPFMGVGAPQGDIEGYLTSTGRIVGTNNIAVGAGLLFGILLVLVVFNTAGLARLILSAWLLVLIYFTATRVAVWGLATPLLVIAAWRFDRPEDWVRLIGMAVGLGLIAGGLFGLDWLSSIMAGRSERLFNVFDVNTLAKLASAYAGITDTLAVSPIIGLAKGDIYQSFVRAYGSLPEELFPASIVSLNVTITNHNQFIFFLRYYGLIGLGLVTVLHWLAWQKVRSKANGRTRAILTAVFLYFLQFTLIQNETLMGSPMVWLLLAVGQPAAEAPQRVIEPMENDEAPAPVFAGIES